MRFRTLSAVMLMAASAGASAAPISLIPSITSPNLPILGVVVLPLALPALPELPLLGTGGLPGLDLSALGGGGHPALPALEIPGLIPLPAVPFPVTDILASLNAIPTLVATMEALAPLALAVPIPVVSPIFANFGD